MYNHPWHKLFLFAKPGANWVRWFILIIPATQRAEIRRTEVEDQSGQKISKTPSQQ
jgi:hypothetical protein